MLEGLKLIILLLIKLGRVEHWV